MRARAHAPRAFVNRGFVCGAHLPPATQASPVEPEGRNPSPGATGGNLSLLFPRRCRRAPFPRCGGMESSGGGEGAQPVHPRPPPHPLHPYPPGVGGGVSAGPSAPSGSRGVRPQGGARPVPDSAGPAEPRGQQCPLLTPSPGGARTGVKPAPAARPKGGLAPVTNGGPGDGVVPVLAWGGFPPEF